MVTNPAPTIVCATLLFLVGCGSSKEVSKEPDWVRTPQSTGISGNLLTATGTGDTPESARKNTLRELSSFFQVKLTSRTVSSTEFSEVTTDEGTSTDRKDIWNEQIFQSTANRLSGITWSEPYLKNGRYWVKGNLDLVTFTTDLKDRISSNEESIRQEVQKAANDPWALLIAGRKVKKFRMENELNNRYLLLLNEDYPTQTMELEKRLDAATATYGIFIQFQPEANSSDSVQTVLKQIRGGFEPATRKFFPEWKWNAGTDTLTLVFTINEMETEKEGSDVTCRGTVSVAGYQSDSERSFETTFSIKSRAISASEANRQFGSSIARRLAEQFPEPQTLIP